MIRPTEHFGYKEILQDLLEFFDGKHLLTIADVKKYTGMVDNRTVKRNFPIKNGTIAAPLFALCLAGGTNDKTR